MPVHFSMERGLFQSKYQRGGQPGEVPIKVPMGKAPPQSNADRKRYHGCLGAAGFQSGLPKRTGPLLQICQSGHHRLMGRRYRRAQEHFGHQEPERGPGDDGQAGPTGLHRL